jgi:hypothetical protein
MDLPTLLAHPELILFESLSGSRAYGLAHESSDTDERGVFILPKHEFFGFDQVGQVADERGNTVYFEIGKFLALSLKNNPTCLELFGALPGHIRRQHPLWAKIVPELFLSKLCERTFGQYAHSQLKKAKGLNKKILNPVAKERKSLLDFCFAIDKGKTSPLLPWLTERGIASDTCGLTQLNNVQSVYALYYAEGSKFRGLLRSVDSEHLLLSQVPQGLQPLTTVYFNSDGYKRYSQDYAAYWAWVENRNDARYETVVNAGRNYDSKNMMHLFRLLGMARDVAEGKGIVLVRPEKEFLFEVKAGKYSLDELLNLADKEVREVSKAFAYSRLQAEPDQTVVNKLLVEIREQFYGH